MATNELLDAKYRKLTGLLDERAMRLILGADALFLGYGGVSAVARSAGVSRTTVHAGIRELSGQGEEDTVVNLADDHTRIRKPGAGRKAHKEKDPLLISDLERLLGKYSATPYRR